MSEAMYQAFGNPADLLAAGMAVVLVLAIVIAITLLFNKK